MADKHRKHRFERCCLFISLRSRELNTLRLILPIIYPYSCVRRPKAPAYLPPHTSPYLQKSAKINSSTFQINNFLRGRSPKSAEYCRIPSDEARKNRKLLFERRDGFDSRYLKQIRRIRTRLKRLNFGAFRLVVTRRRQPCGFLRTKNHSKCCAF